MRHFADAFECRATAVEAYWAQLRIHVKTLLQVELKSFAASDCQQMHVAALKTKARYCGTDCFTYGRNCAETSRTLTS